MQLQKFLDLWNKGIIFFNPRAANYWHMVTPCFVSLKPERPGRYYLDFTSKANYAQGFDKNGIPMFKYLDEIPATYHPTAICQYALGLYDCLFDSNFKNGEIKRKFLTQADWLVNNKTIRNGMALWLFHYPDKTYKLSPPWYSAMTQGEAISVLCRAYTLDGDEKYISTSEEALIPFELPVSKGGVINRFQNIPVYEEFPVQKVTGVLNGAIFSLFGLYDLSLINKDSNARFLFENGVENIIQLLKFYDLGYWSRYDLYNYPIVNPASYTYHNLHIEQLKALYILTGREIFREYSEKWFKQNQKLVNRIRALINKLIYMKNH